MNGELLLSTCETELASKTGLSQETIHRELHKLEEQKLVRVERGSITVLEVPALERVYSAEA